MHSDVRMKSAILLSLVFASQIPRCISGSIADISALYTLSVAPSTIHADLISRLALTLSAGTLATLSSADITVVSANGLSASPCSSLVTVPTTYISSLSSGCFRITFRVSAGLTEYETNYRTTFWPIQFALNASDPLGLFNVSVPPDAPEGPQYVWTSDSPSSSPSYSPWTLRSFPQETWMAQSPSCVSGVACVNLTVAPSARYQHSAVTYMSWNFARDVLPHSTLCKLPSIDNSGCTSTCLTDPTCFGSSNFASYYNSVSDSVFWKSASLFPSDDGSAYPVADSHSLLCPPACCGTRRTCMRTRDALGRVAEFDKNYMLVFGGRTRQKSTLANMDVFLDCEAVLASGVTADQTYNSCLEFESDELWRYDISANLWELLKPRSLAASTSSSSPSFPVGRYAHAAATVTLPAAQDLQSTRRQYMFVFGGFSQKCTSGLCNDLWRYEIPWAAQAYWPTAGVAGTKQLSNWNTGNTWVQLASSPYGGVYRHSMVSTTSGSALYVYGGQQAGVYSSQLLVYTLASNTWSSRYAMGYRYFTRSVVDYTNKTLVYQVSDMGEMSDDAGMDQVGPVGTNLTGANLPLGRADFCLAHTPSDVIYMHSGFRTYSSPFPSTDAATNPYPTYPYYLPEDFWKYNISSNEWSQIFTKPNTYSTNLSSPLYPSARKGAACVLIPATTKGGDEAGESGLGLMLLGGHMGDEVYGDAWMFGNFSSSLRGDHEWTRYSPGDGEPPNMTYHTMVYDDVSDKVLLFGGVSWTSSNLSVSDQLTADDRLCFLNARNILITACSGSSSGGDTTLCAVNTAKTAIEDACNSGASTFCCAVYVANGFASVTTLTGLSTACTSECQSNSFQTQLTLNFTQGLWVYDRNACSNDCTSAANGECRLSVCVCKPGWTGDDCSIPTCSGSFCYFDAHSLTQHCQTCSGNGACSVGGTCECDPGWTGADCSTVQCNANCNTNGLCLTSEFPINQCICDPSFSGSACTSQLCLNGCSGHGNCSSGTCNCESGFHGTDCSVYVFTAAANHRLGSALVGLVSVLIVLTTVG